MTSFSHIQNQKQPSLSIKFISAGTAACFADIVTFPLDTTKVRLQLQGEKIVTPTNLAVKPELKYRGLIHALGLIAKEEGVRGLYKGLVPGLQRQLCFSSVRLGLYDEFKNMYLKVLGYDEKKKKMPISIRLLAGITTGALSVMLAQPTDVVKIRMQGQGLTSTRIYKNSFQAYRSIATEEGVRGLYKGLMPNILRNIAVGVTEMVTYDIAKDGIVTSGLLSDGIPCHFVSAAIAGFVAVVVSSPIDVVKTRYVNSFPGQYSGVLNCALSIYTTSGFTGFYKGCIPYFSRICSWSIVMFMSYEQMKSFLSTKTQNRSLPKELEREKSVNLQTRM